MRDRDKTTTHNGLLEIKQEGIKPQQRRDVDVHAQRVDHHVDVRRRHCVEEQDLLPVHVPKLRRCNIERLHISHVNP